MFLDYISLSPERVSVGEEGEGHSMLMDRKQKRGGESGARNLEAESIRSGAESTGGRVKLKTVDSIFKAQITYVPTINYDNDKHLRAEC